VLAFAVAGMAFFIKFVVRGFRPDPEEGTGLGPLVGGLAALGMLTLMTYSVVRYHNMMLDEALKPFQTIWGWFN
jgi:hypothetical protein